MKGLRDVFPTSPPHDAAEILWGHPELTTERRLLNPTLIERADFEHEGLSEFSHPVKFACDEEFSPLADHILCVISECSEEEMCRINTARVVAIMEDIEIGRYRPKVQFPTEAMGIDSSRLVASKRQSAIASPGFAARPLPASIGDCDESPKSVFDGISATLTHNLIVSQGGDSWRT